MLFHINTNNDIIHLSIAIESIVVVPRATIYAWDIINNSQYWIPHFGEDKMTWGNACLFPHSFPIRKSPRTLGTTKGVCLFVHNPYVLSYQKFTFTS